MFKTMKKCFPAALAVTLLCAPVAAADGIEAVYKAKCAKCHGDDGEGKTPAGKKFSLKPLSAPEAQKLSDAEMTELISKGKKKMPKFDTKLTAEEIKALVGYVRKFAKK